MQAQVPPLARSCLRCSPRLLMDQAWGWPCGWRKSSERGRWCPLCAAVCRG